MYKRSLCWLIFPSLVLSQLQPVTFLVTVPDSTDHVYLIGDHKKLGNWDHPKAVKLYSINDSLFITTVRLPKNQRIEFKFTRGSWAKEALNEHLSVPQNHSIHIGDQDTVHFTILSWKDWRKFPWNQITGDLIIHENVYSPQLDNNRTVLVWFPPSYKTQINKRYPVLYLNDGQNVFTSTLSLSGQEWRLDETVTALIKEQKIEEIIMVAVYHGEDRTAEYSPKHQGNDYADFLVETLKPWIDQTYRTRPEREYTAVLGSSMGGLISFHLGWKYPETFSMAGCLSPAFLVDRNEIVKRVKKSKYKPQCKWTIQNGTEALESKLQPSITKMVQSLNRKGYKQNMDYYYQVYPGEGHSEEEWAKEVKDTLLFFFRI